MHKDASRSDPGRATSAEMSGRIRTCYDAAIRDENTVPVG